MLTTNDKSKKWLWLTLLSTVAIVLSVQIPLLISPGYVDEDLRFFYWLHRFVNPSLFEADPLLGYQFAEIRLGSATLLLNKVSLLYGVLYAGSSHFVSPFVFSKLLIFPLSLIASYHLFRLSERVANGFTAFLLSVIFTLIVAVPFSEMSLSSGLPRAFTLPLLLAMLHYLQTDNRIAMAVVLVTSVIYPPIFLTILLTYAVKFGLESFRERTLALTRSQLAAFGVALLISILLLLPATRTGLNTVPTRPGEAQETTVSSSPLFGGEGRYSLLEPFPLTANGGVIDSGLIGFYTLVLMILLIPTALLLHGRLKLLPAPFWYLVFASLIGFGLSWSAIIFTPSATFHMPSRYMRGTAFIVSLLMFVINGPQAIQVGSRRLAKSRSNFDALLLIAGLIGLATVQFSEVTRVLTILSAALTLALLALIVLRRSNTKLHADNSRSPENSNRGREWASTRIQAIVITLILVFPILVIKGPAKFHRPRAEAAELVEFVKTLPRTAVISGYPCYLDDIPLYSQRMILFSCEIESRDMGMMKSALDAYYSETEHGVLSFCRQYGVDYMVAGEETFTEEFRSQERIIFEPLNSFLRQQLEGRSAFAVNQIPESARLFQNESYFVFPCTADALASVR